MKIRSVSPEIYPKVLGLLKQSFPRSNKEVVLIEKLHKKNTELDEWVCLHINKVIAYIAFTKAYNEKEVCGLHLGPVVVKPEFQNQGVGAELIRFALRQEKIKNSTIFTLGLAEYYKQFGFIPCLQQRSSFATKKTHLLCLHNELTESFTVGYEKAFGK
ncbi:MAG: GNAT family N-acetyltransferase [Desulfotalea sp.]|nr:MAG: GNAT family N-acetyltransferase [Desulfotalea sp.]